jgi:hypothetical protein
MSTVLRTPSFRDDDMTYRLPPTGRLLNEIWSEDLVCKAPQTSPNQTAGSPALLAQAGNTLILLYQENGHVTKLAEDGGHDHSGNITVFGTSNSSPTDTFQAFMNTTSPCGDAVLLAEAGFDDGVCFQNNGSPKALERQNSNRPRAHLEVEGPDVWCGIEVILPSSLSLTNTFTLYWIWTFDGKGFVERYTTCLDIIVI